MNLQNDINSRIYVLDANIDGNLKELKLKSLVKYLKGICIRRKIEWSNLDLPKLALKVYTHLKIINTLSEIDEQIISSVSDMLTSHYDYSSIAIHILIDNLHNSTHDDYLLVVRELADNVNKNGKPSSIVSPSFLKFVETHYKEINANLNYLNDYNQTIFGFRTLEKAYLKKSSSGKIIERPQHMFMRVAIGIHYRTIPPNDLSKIFQTYNLISEGFFTHATPTLFNAGTRCEQLASCFLLGTDDDMEKIGESWKDCAVISKYSGGIGINLTNLRVDGAYIDSTCGTASGIRVAKVYNDVARYADQGGKRAGSIAIYMEPWHGDIFRFLELKKQNGAETERTRDLFLAMFINDIFMRRVLNDEPWSLMCPSECPDLLSKYGKEFDAEYIAYEKKGKYLHQVSARDLWFKIMETQIESGMPYILFKDAINYKSNQINYGVINNSNLCAEIVEYSDSDEYAVCTLSSICLPKFVKNNEFDYEDLYRVSRIVCRNLNNIIDINFYPVDKAKKSNMMHRPIGIGVQGLADVFALLKISFDSPRAKEINKIIFETIYFGAISESVSLAREFGPYETYQGSPVSKGLLQFDLWGIKESNLSGKWNWQQLRLDIKKYGVRNSLLTASMPTATTAQIMNNNEACEAITENIYTRSTLAGDYYVVNQHLMKDLMKLNLWNDQMVDLIKYYEGSIQLIPGIPDQIKEIYRTVWEISQLSIIGMYADRGPFIDQTQSMNLFVDKPSYAIINTCLFRAWELGLKTGMYYLRSKAASKANQFGIDIDLIKKIQKEPVVCSRKKGPGACEACSS